MALYRIVSCHTTPHHTIKRLSTDCQQLVLVTIESVHIDMVRDECLSRFIDLMADQFCGIKLVQRLKEFLRQSRDLNFDALVVVNPLTI